MTTICIIQNEDSYDCIHVSIGKKSAIIRTWPEGAQTWLERSVILYEADDSVRNAVHRFSNREACLIACPELEDDPEFSQQGLKYKDPRWGKVFHFLRENAKKLTTLQGPQRQKTLPEKHEDSLRKGKIIPITSLRKFYSSLRTGLSASDFHHLLCSLPAKMAARLAWQFSDASDTFSLYANIEEPFAPEEHSKARNILANLQKYDRFARCLQARVIASGKEGRACSVTDHPELEFRFVDFEISPLRTTGAARFADNRSGRSSGGGGLDLLLSTSPGGFPIVGEIKAETDTDVFLALVQSLVYASELTTANQLRRLKSTYPVFKELKENSPCDIFIIYQKTVPEDSGPKLLKETTAIVECLLTGRKNAVRDHVRRIAFIGAELLDDGGLTFTCKPEHIFSAT